MSFTIVFLVCLVASTDAATFAPSAAQTTENFGDCGNTLYNDSFGYVISPNYPSNYGYNQNCSNIIWAPQRSYFSLYFLQFQLEYDCSRDWLEISCLDNSQYGPYRYCGNYDGYSLSVDVCSEVLLWFHSDSYNSYQGFNIQYSVYPFTDGTNAPAEATYSPAVTANVSDCGNTVYSDSYGYVTSPNYPSYYGYDQNCSSIISAPQRSMFYLYFQELYLEYDCSRDWLEISCLDNSQYGPNRYCGYYTGSNQYIYGCSEVLLWFHSDGSNNYPGFNIQYSVSPDSSVAPTETTYAPPVTTSDLGCGNTYYYGPSGVISSPNYPNYYYNYVSCYYYVYASTGSSLSFVFRSLNTEPYYDSVTISCPGNSSIPQQQFSGYSLPYPVSMPWCSQGLVQFQNYGSTYNVFSLDYYVSNGDCGNTLYDDSFGYVTSPNYPSYYGYYQNCSNIIWAPQRSTFYFYFQEFYVEHDCSRDWLEIRCLDNSQYGPYRYCGNYYGGSQLYIYECSEVLLWFHSDGSNNYPGFNIQYNVFTVTTVGYTETTAPPAVTTTGSASSCGRTAYYGPSGVISSSNYPYYYFDNLNCNYYIYASTGSSLSFVFKSFNTESCCDRVTISCPSNSSIPQQQFSGYSLPNAVSIPWCSQGLVQFRTDGSVVASGFSLDYYVSDGGCGNTVYNDSYGYVTSPDYPNYYGYYQNCSNIIFAPQRSTFYLYFQQLYLEYDCSRDWLEISCLDNSQYGPYKYCGNYNYHNMYIYGCSQLLLWFHSDGSSNYPGFSIQYNFYPDYTSVGYAETTAPPAVTTTGSACGESSLYGSHGVISSPNYPGKYTNYLYCDFYVYASTGSSLSFVFKSVHLEASDLLTISCPPNSNFPPQEYSGHTLPDPVSIPWCNQGRVNFRTDDTDVTSGFSLDYYVSDAGCGNTAFTGSNGYVNSPNWPEFYRYNKNCSNIIWTTQQSTINLYFHSFNLPSNCNFDWLEISCLDNSEFSPQRYCGNYNSYNLYIYRCSQVLLSFHSDDTINYQGFNIEYTIYPDGATACGETSHYGPSGVISSPNYPGNYSNFLYCDHTIYAETGSSLSLIFTSLHVQEGFDFVTISCPANSSSPKYEYTGVYFPSPFVIPECSKGLVNFHTDDSVVSSGFSLNYYVSARGCGNTQYYSSYGHVTSPNWPKNYGYNQNCYNIIHAGQRSTFYLNFQPFILQRCCSCDWLEVSCPDNSNYGTTRYCGSNVPVSTYISNCSQVLLWFHSDSSFNDQGFNIEYSVYTNAGSAAASKVLRSGALNAAENTPSNGKSNAAEEMSINGKPNAAEKVPSYGKPNAAKKVPSNGKPNAAEKVPSNGKPNAAENMPNNGKPNAAESMPKYGKPNAAESMPKYGKPNAAENMPRYEKPNAAENMPKYGKPNSAENLPKYGKPNAAENMPNNGKPPAKESKKGK